MKLIAIDIGSHSMKLLEADASFRTLQLINYHEEPVPQSGDTPSLDEHLNVLKKMMEEVTLKQSRIVINIPSSLTTTRYLTLPFTDRRKIALSLPFELEEELPFDMDDLMLDHRILAREGKISKVAAGVVTKKDLAEFITKLGENGINPDIITIGSMAMANVTPLRFNEYEGVYAILNVGHGNTNISLIKEETPLLTRSIPLGGLSITKQLMSTYKVSYEEAERAKIEQGFVLAGTELKVTKEQERFSETIKEALAPLIKEINQTFLSAKSEGKININQVLLCGGTSLLRNFPAYIHEELHTPAEPMQILEGLELSQIPVNPRNEAVLSELTALAMAGTSAQMQHQINFRKGEFAKIKREGLLEPQYAYMAKIAFIVITLLFFNMIGKYTLLKAQNLTLKKHITAQLNTLFPNIPKTIIASPQRLKAYIEKKADEQNDQIEQIGSRATREFTPLHTVSELSKLTPQNITVEFSSLDIIEDKVKIVGLAASREAVEKIFSTYSAYVNFSDAKKMGIQPTDDGKWQKFTFEFKIKL